MRAAYSAVLLLLLSSCAVTQKRPQTPGVAEEVAKGNISIQSVLDLARGSYLKGCVDGKNFNQSSKPASFKTCVEFAKKHQEEIREILEQEPKPLRRPLKKPF